MYGPGVDVANQPATVAECVDATYRRPALGRGPGRPKGSPNKATAILKTAILDAFHQMGGVEYLMRVAEEDPRTFCALLARVLPAEIKADVTVNADLANAIADARARLAKPVEHA